jgi:hypothetical protein
LRIQQQGFDSFRDSIGACLINDQAAPAASDFTKCTVPAAYARFAMDKTFRDWQSETFHERRINREATFAISAQERFVVDVTQPAQRPATHPQFPNFTNDLIERRSYVSPDQSQLESEVFLPQLFGGAK